MRVSARSIRVIGWWIAGVLLAAAAFTIWWHFIFWGPPDTFGDMSRQLDSIDLPADFEFAELSGGGLRSGFAAAGTPSIRRIYIAPWSHGELCDRLKALAATHGPVRKGLWHTACSFEVTIPSGWTAKLVNVWSYPLEFAAVDPETLRPIDRERYCVSNEEKPLSLRIAKCGMEEGDALVYVVLRGKRGW